MCYVNEIGVVVLSATPVFSSTTAQEYLFYTLQYKIMVY